MCLLKREGQKLKLNILLKDLESLRGSFYAHFSDRRDFVASVAFYWADTLTATVLDNLSQNEEKGEKLRLLMQTIKNHELGKYDIVMRAWALDEPLVAEQVEKVDIVRYEYIKSVFTEMGFTGNELETRSMVFQVYHSLSNALQVLSLKKTDLKTKNNVVNFSLENKILSTQSLILKEKMYLGNPQLAPTLQN